MLLGARTGAWSGHKRVLRLICSGHQFVNVQSNYSASSKYLFDYACDTNDVGLFGHERGNDTSQRFTILVKSGYVGSYGLTRTGFTNIVQKGETRQKVLVDFQNCKVFVNESQIISFSFKPTSLRDTVPLMSWAWNDAIHSADFVGSFYGYRMYNGSTPFYLCYPAVARFNGTDEAFLYNSVSGEYMRNQGTGTFGWEELNGTVVAPT